jgi:hypothetical protein
MATILDVVDNYFSANKVDDIATAPGKLLHGLGDEVRRFVAAYEPPALDQGLHPTYLGGWPSANFWDSLNGDLVMSTLLYSGQVLAKDPVSDWFSPEQYRTRHLAARAGYLDPNTGEPNVVGTRAFLRRVIPALFRMRPLIEKQYVVLVPSHRLLLQHQSATEELHRRLVDRIASDPAGFARQFRPKELPVEDNIRGLFAFLGGDREGQIRKVIGYSLEYFAAEYVLAERHGATYTAPFRYEQHVCAEGLERALLRTPSERVVRAVTTSPLPMFSGLTPAKIAEVHDDDYFLDFRGDLYRLYGSLPADATAKEITEAEGALLRPVVERLEKEARQGHAGRLALPWGGATVRVVSNLLAPGIGTVAAGVGELLGIADLQRPGSQRGSLTVWRKLVAHGRTVQQELAGVTPMKGANLAGPDFWGIPPIPSMTVTVAAGMLIADTIPDTEQQARIGEGSDLEPYKPCSCGSGTKFKFCCKGLRR